MLEILIERLIEEGKITREEIEARVEELKAYIVKDNRIIPYINSITPLIIEYFPDNKRYLTYCKDPEYHCNHRYFHWLDRQHPLYAVWRLCDDYGPPQRNVIHLNLL